MGFYQRRIYPAFIHDSFLPFNQSHQIPSLEPRLLPINVIGRRAGNRCCLPCEGPLRYPLKAPLELFPLARIFLSPLLFAFFYFHLVRCSSLPSGRLQRRTVLEVLAFLIGRHTTCPCVGPSGVCFRLVPGVEISLCHFSNLLCPPTP